MIDFKIEDSCYVNDKFIGTTLAKKITINILNPNNEINLENKEISVEVGMVIDGKEELVPFGNFIIDKPDNEEVKEKTSFVGYDYMVKFNNTLYKDKGDYPKPLSTLLNEICFQVGVKLGDHDFVNYNYMVPGNPFTNNEDCRTVLSNIAQLAGGFAKIGRDNNLYIVSLKDISKIKKVKDVHYATVREINLNPLKLLATEKNSTDEVLDGNTYLDDFSKNEQWGELNSLILRLSGIEGENTVIQDEESIEENGLTELIIEDNAFLTSAEEREKVINALWDNLTKIKYLPFKATYYGYPYLDSGDLLYIQDTKDKGYLSYAFNHTFTFKGAFSGTLEAQAMTKTQTAYKNTVNVKTKFRYMERKIDKINGEISDVIHEVNGNTEKISEHTQTIDEIKDTLQSVTTTVSNTVKEVQVMYALSDSATQAPTNGWSVEAPEWQEGKYMWQKTVTTFSDDTQEESQPTCIQGANGQDGKNGVDGTNGKDGLGIKSIETQYYLSTSETETTGGTWKSTQDKWSKGKYIWTRSKIIWSDNSVTYSQPIVAEGLNSANENADSANEGTKEVTTKMSEVEKTVEGITQTVNQTTERLNNDYSTTEQMNSAIEQTAENINLSVTESIDNIQVGGTNLIPNSGPYNLDNWLINNTSIIELTLADEETAPFNKALRIRTLSQPTVFAGIRIVPTSKVLEENKEYCFSIWLKSTATTKVTVGYEMGGEDVFTVTTEWQKFQYKFTATKPQTVEHRFVIYLPAGTTAGLSVYAHSIKLEEGNKNTAWSPAPSDDVKGFEIGTKIEQNAKSVQIAWNQLSQYIKFEGDNQDATIAFYDQNSKFGEMGVNTLDNTKYISFAVPVKYGSNTKDGMAWGIQTEDDKFWPILFIKDFFMAPKQSGNFGGNLVLNYCDFLLGSGAIKAGNIRLGADDTANGIYFEDTTTGKILMSIYPKSTVQNYETINILDKIRFYKNQSGSNTFKIGTDKTILMTDEGYFSISNGEANFFNTGYNIWDGNLKVSNGNFEVLGGDIILGQTYDEGKVSFTLNLKSMGHIGGNITVDGNVYANNISSDRRLKDNIEDSNTNALDLINKIKHRQFEKKDDGKQYNIGYIAQELEEIDKNFVLIKPKDEKEDEKYYINELPLLATATKAIQELNQKIEQLQHKVDELEQKLNEKEK